MSHILKSFETIGARVRVTPGFGPAFRIDVRRDSDGEYYELGKPAGTRVTVAEASRDDRHLLLAVAEPVKGGRGESKSKYLCGYDERAWFVAAVPEVPGVRDVASAKDALAPAIVREALERAGVKNGRRHDRRTAGFIRQGEWFFLPHPELMVDPLRVLRDEPIRRGRGKPHACQYLYREGGETVYVSRAHPDGITFETLRGIPRKQRGFMRVMRRDGNVYAKGTVRHPDHHTILLPCWHLVVMNTESESRAMRNVAFLD